MHVFYCWGSSATQRVAVPDAALFAARSYVNVSASVSAYRTLVLGRPRMPLWGTSL